MTDLHSTLDAIDAQLRAIFGIPQPQVGSGKPATLEEELLHLGYFDGPGRIDPRRSR